MSLKTALVTIGKDVDVEAGKLLSFLAAAEKKTPAAAAALGVILQAVGKAVSDATAVANNPTKALDIQFDQQSAADLKTVWPDLVAFMATLGVKI